METRWRIEGGHDVNNYLLLADTHGFFESHLQIENGCNHTV